MSENRPNKHHYLPEFYLRYWCLDDNKLCQFSQPYQKQTKAKRVYPAETGFQRRLYTLREFPGKLAHQIESEFFASVDSEAAVALRVMHSGSLRFTARQRSAWTRFIVSLLLRMPEDIEKLREEAARRFSDVSQEDEEKYTAQRSESDPETLSELLAEIPADEFDTSVFTTLLEMIDNSRVGNHINNMTWMLKDFGDVKHRFLTSDRPIVTTNGLDNERGHIAVPIGPKLLFVAVNTKKMVGEIRSSDPKLVMSDINDQVARHSVKYVYSSSDREFRFVEKRLATVYQRRLIDIVSGKKGQRA